MYFVFIDVLGTIKSCQKYLIEYNYKKLKNMLESSSTGCKWTKLLTIYIIILYRIVEKKNLRLKIKEVLKKDSIPLKV